MSGETRERFRSRERAKIFYDILCAIIGEEDSGRVAKITRVQNLANLPSDRFRRHLKEMEKLELIRHDRTLASTENGKIFVAEYKKVLETLRHFGLG